MSVAGAGAKHPGGGRYECAPKFSGIRYDETKQPRGSRSVYSPDVVGPTGARSISNRRRRDTPLPSGGRGNCRARPARMRHFGQTVIFNTCRNTSDGEQLYVGASIQATWPLKKSKAG